MKNANTLSEAKLRKEQLLQMASELKEQGTLGFEGLSVRFVNKSLVHKVTKPSLWAETISAIATDMEEEAGQLDAVISESQSRYDSLLLEAKTALAVNDYHTAHEKYKAVYNEQPSQYLEKLIKELDAKCCTILSDAEKATIGEIN